MSGNQRTEASPAPVSERPVPSWVPPHVAALVELLRLGDEVVAWNAEAFDGDGHVSGADAVEFLCGHRERLRHLMFECRRKRNEPRHG